MTHRLKMTHPKMDFLFQSPRVVSNKFNPEADTVWFCNSPLGTCYLGSMMRTMSLKAEIKPPITNHCVRATSVTILSAANVQTPHIKYVTGHKSDTSIESYSTKPSFPQKEKMSTILSSLIGGENSNTPYEAQQIGEANSDDIPKSCPVVPRPPLENISLSVNVQQPSTSTTTLPSQQAYYRASAPNFQFQCCSVTIENNTKIWFYQTC